MPGYEGAYTASRFFDITPSDTANLEPRPDGIWVNVAGNVVAVDRDGNQVTFICVGGSVLPISPLRILATGTTATGLKGMRP